MDEKIVALDRVSQGNEYGDLVQCMNCERVMLVNSGTKICPECDESGTLSWVDDLKQEYRIDDQELLLVDVE